VSPEILVDRKNRTITFLCEGGGRPDSPLILDDLWPALANPE
jgi:hypothetical protein